MTSPPCVSLYQRAERPLSIDPDMKLEFIQEVIETEDVARLLECLSGWETVVFVVEDDPESLECGGLPPL